MPLSTSLVASVVGALIETAAQSPQPSDVPVAQYRMLAARGALPPEAKVGFMRPPIERGVIVIDDE
ncbi:MAG: hypothetical protein LBC91_01455, partial [Candidatus Accumulibacter sp.]|nr:hypothetical protein [Accumulibacter sp.]